MTDTTTQAVERCAECTCKDGGIFCNWIAHGDPQVRQLVKDHAALLAERDRLQAELQNATDEANFCGAERAAYKDRADALYEALAELLEEVDFFLGLLKSGNPVYGDRMKDSADHARKALMKLKEPTP